MRRKHEQAAITLMEASKPFSSSQCNWTLVPQGYGAAVSEHGKQAMWYRARRPGTRSTEKWRGGGRPRTATREGRHSPLDPRSAGREERVAHPCLPRGAGGTSEEGSGARCPEACGESATRPRALRGEGPTIGLSSGFLSIYGLSSQLRFGSDDRLIISRETIVDYFHSDSIAVWIGRSYRFMWWWRHSREF